ncbi:MAG: hypothetical protein L0216_10680 [Planctomycetales bacterium]|nr:hypothetical protein [Planctomycetales bacterium]
MVSRASVRARRAAAILCAGALLAAGTAALRCRKGSGEPTSTGPHVPAEPLVQPTERPFKLARGSDLAYLIHPSGAGEWDLYTLPVPPRVALSPREDGLAEVRAPVGPRGPDAKSLPGLDTEFSGTMRTDGVVRAGASPGSRPFSPIYETFLTLLLLRPPGHGSAPVGERWTDAAPFPSPDGRTVLAALRVERLPDRTLGDRRCEAFRWELELPLPGGGPFGDARSLDAEGLTFWDPARGALAAAEVELRFSQELDWEFTKWLWYRVVAEGVPYEGAELDGRWIAGALMLQPVDQDPGLDRRWAGEDMGRKRLYAIGRSEEQWKVDKRVDQDGDGRGEYGFLCELAGTANLRTPGGRLGAMVPLRQFGLHPFHGRTDARGVVVADAYCHVCFLAGAGGKVLREANGVPPDGDPANADVQEGPGGYGCFAWPNDLADGEWAYFVNSPDQVFRAPARDLGWVGPGTGPDPRLTRPEGVKWEAVPLDLPAPRRKVRFIAAPGLEAEEEALGLAVTEHEFRVWLHQPDQTRLLAPETRARILVLERRWRDAFRDHRLQAAEVRPIVEELREIMGR